MEGLLHAVADKAAIGAPGGTEGDAHVEGDLLRPQGVPGLQPRLGALDAQPPPLGGDKIHVPELPVRRLRAPCLQQLRSQLGRPDAGKGPPGGGDAGEGPGGLKEAELHRPLPQPLPLVLVRSVGDGGPGLSPGGAPVHGQNRLRQGLTGLAGQRDQGPIRLLPLVDRPLAGEKGQQALLHGVAVVVALKNKPHSPAVRHRWGLIFRSRARVERGPWPGQTL